MHLDRLDSYKREEKKLKKHIEEQKMYEKILGHIKNCDNYEELKSNPLSKTYGYEALKEDLSGYHRFNLCKNGGKIRLIFTINEESNTVYLTYISLEHYVDFKKWLRQR
ncbi:MAG: hypothetical protein IJN90_01480 [Bacilli bacterium]|nr:hypothetical protein [Bacilli bacterium]